MCYQMIHLEVAYQLLDKFDWVKNKGDFILGSVAPDSVHFYPAYNVHLKECSHLWNHGPRWGVTMAPDKWRDAILEFWQLHKKTPNRDFIAGYCVHILTDGMNDKIIWAPFRSQLENGAEYDAVYEVYATEAIGSDQWLYQNSLNKDAIFSLLKTGESHTIPGCVVDEDIETQRRHLLNNQYTNITTLNIDNYQYCSKQVIFDFIQKCVDTIQDLL